MLRSAHPWGTPPWTIDFRPAKRALPRQVDFAVVGAGFSGLSAAACLAKLAPNKSVLVIESESIGNGASGRTGGMVLDETAAGSLPGLGDVLSGYKKILREFKVEAHLALPGAFELARHKTRNDSPISWQDSGELRVVRTVPGGHVDPGKVLSGLARAAERAGAQILEHGEVIEINSFAKSQKRERHGSISLRVRLKMRCRAQEKLVVADKVLLATNAGSLSLSGLAKIAEPKLTLALATAPLSSKQLHALGLSTRQPFYTVDFPYLWGRLLEHDGVIFGAGLLPPPTGDSLFSAKSSRAPKITFGDLLRFDVRRGAARERFNWLESRIRNMHPALKNMRVTHRWGGPILFTRNFHPVFRHHSSSEKILVLGAFAGHGVALSVYLGRYAAEHLAKGRPLPSWR